MIFFLTFSSSFASALAFRISFKSLIFSLMACILANFLFHCLFSAVTKFGYLKQSIYKCKLEGLYKQLFVDKQWLRKTTGVERGEFLSLSMKLLVDTTKWKILGNLITSYYIYCL